MTRNFGLTSGTSGSGLRGHDSQSRSSYAPDTRRNPELARYYSEANSIPPLPAQSLRDEPLSSGPDIRERAAGWFVTGFFACWFLAPVICIFVVLKFR